jgi:5'-nucleotidase
LNAFGIQLYLSRSTKDVKMALESGIAAAVLYAPPEGFSPMDEQIRVAFDGDAVLFSDEAERIYKSKGLEAFIKHERERAKEILPDGPFAPFLKTISFLQNEQLTKGRIMTALVTARSNATQERVVHTLRAWGVQIDQMFFMAGKQKRGVLEAFRPHIYFDDQDVHGVPASAIAPTGKVIPSYDQ